MYPRQSSLRRPLSPFLPSTPRMETEGPAPSDGEVGEHPDRLPSENRIGRRTDMEKTKNVRKKGRERGQSTHSNKIGLHGGTGMG